jgi:hypothetical protein
MSSFPHSSSLSENAPVQEAGRQNGGEKPLHDILAGADIQNLIEQRTEVIDKIRQALDLLGEAENIAKQAHLGFPRLKNEHTLDMTGPFAERARAEAALIQAVDAKAWKFLLDASRLSRFMDGTAHKRWNDIIYSDTPELTTAAITETFGRLHAERGAMFERKVMEIFRALSWDRRAGLPRLLGKKLIVHDLIHDGRWPRSDMTRKVDDLECAFSVFDGKPGSDKHGVINAGMSTACGAGADEMETDYLHIHWFQNGNGHITFKRHDLVAQMNGVIRKHCPDALSAAQKARG